MSKPFKTHNVNSHNTSHTRCESPKHSPAAAVQVEIPIDTNGNDNRTIVTQIRGCEPIIVCLVIPVSPNKRSPK